MDLIWGRETGNLSSQEHRYYSGRTYLVEGEGERPECVWFRYDFEEPETPWRFFHDHDADCAECRDKGRDLGPEGVGALLEEWGFGRVFALDDARREGGPAAARQDGDGGGG